MKCPICGKDLELRTKQVGTGENGDPVYNEYAICRDCKKQWNLDKQRAKKAAQKKAAKDEISDKELKTAAPKRKSSATASSSVSSSGKKAASAKSAGQKPADAKATVRKTTDQKPAQKKAAATKTAAKNNAGASDEEKRYSNIPPERVRTKHEKAARKGYEDMLATGAIGKPLKKKARPADETKTISSAAPAEKKASHANASSRKSEPEFDEYEDDYYDDTPRFRPMRILLGMVSLLGFGYFIYRGFAAGLTSTAEDGSTSGLIFVILSLCMLVAALLYLIMQKTNSVFAFLLPMLFYLGSGVLAFLNRGDDLQLLIAAVAAAVLAVISLILAITSRGGGDYDDEDDYDDSFEDDYADDY